MSAVASMADAVAAPLASQNFYRYGRCTIEAQEANGAGVNWLKARLPLLVSDLADIVGRKLGY